MSISFKLFAKDATIYALGNSGLRASALMLIPIYTHYLPVRDYGVWATLQTTMQGNRSGTPIRFPRLCGKMTRI